MVANYQIVSTFTSIGKLANSATILADADNLLYLSVEFFSSEGSLWRTDGTTEGTFEPD
ncbi:MAG: hypothetical protein AAF383_14520 [Cyanobacteria bacterium P01_A01_bin.83]